MRDRKRDKFLPFILTAVVLAADQATKTFIAQRWPVGTIIADVFGNGLLEIWHVRNKVIAFSLGRSLPDALRPVLFIALPLVVLGLLLWYYLTSSELSRLQRWAVCGIVGGGLGNLIDRIFRPEGVVDFISVKFFGIFGFERWPTFNVADSAVVVCTGILLLSIIFSPGEWRARRKP